MSGQPHYKFEDFMAACKIKTSVRSINTVLADARNDFSLTTFEQLQDFIANRGLEDLCFQNSIIWENNPDKSTTIFTDAYEFRSLGKRGYISFFYNEKTRYWIIKSFHLSDKRDTTIADKLKEAIEPKPTSKGIEK